MAIGTIRRFEWADADGLVPVFNDLAGDAGRQITADELRLSWSQPDVEPTRRCFVALDSGAPVGYAIVAYEGPIRRAVASGGVARAYRRRGVGRALLRRCVELAAELGVDVLHAEALAGDEAARALLASEGFSEVKRFWQMRRDESAPPETRLPPGFSTRPLATERDTAALTELQNTAFGENWGFSPNTVAQIAARVAQNPGGPEGILFIMDGDKPAAYNWTMLNKAADGLPEGVISMTGVHPNYRGRGIGRAVVSAGIAHLAARGAASVSLEVDSDNAPARELYLKLGFRRVSKTVWRELRFGDGDAKGKAKR